MDMAGLSVLTLLAGGRDLGIYIWALALILIVSGGVKLRNRIHPGPLSKWGKALVGYIAFIVVTTYASILWIFLSQ